MKISWRTELPQWIVIAAMFAVAAWSWPRLPEQIPTHWNIQGQVDGYGNKFVGLLFFPLMVAAFYVGLRLMYLIDPGKKNYASFSTALGLIRMTITFTFAILYTAGLLATFGYNVNMTMVACFAVGAMLIIIGNFMGKIRPNWFVGVRTPWTLSSKQSWDKTHRLAGWLLLLMGLSSIASGIIQTLWAFAVMIAVVVLGALWLVVYSYLVYRRDPDRTSPAGVSPESPESHVDKFTLPS